MDRRKFMASAAVAAAASSALAAEGGKPVREKPLKAGFFGPLYYDEKERQQVVDVLETGRPFRWYGPGKEPPMKVATFEKEFAAWMKTKYALAVTSGTAALQTAMAAIEIGPGDEVILPAWTWHSCFNAIVLAGALPGHSLEYPGRALSHARPGPRPRASRRPAPAMVRRRYRDGPAPPSRGDDGSGYGTAPDLRVRQRALPVKLRRTGRCPPGVL